MMVGMQLRSVYLSKEYGSFFKLINESMLRNLRLVNLSIESRSNLKLLHKLRFMSWRFVNFPKESGSNSKFSHPTKEMRWRFLKSPNESGNILRRVVFTTIFSRRCSFPKDIGNLNSGASIINCRNCSSACNVNVSIIRKIKMRLFSFVQDFKFQL